MGKKTKKAKERLDKFYNLAKEMGYRSRAAFKLVQINKKYDFLSGCRTVVDLCGAPGSWSQVAAKHMPSSSTIICVDLVKIAPIKGVKSLQGDIMTEKTQGKVKMMLEKKPCDAVIHDGAPNVGGTWDKDAFAQNWLTLKACQFACSLLRPGGWFITKVFRSRDFTRLMWVFNQLFEKVEAFKPQASRQQSAEVFVVCAGYRAPRKLDPKLFGKAVFDPSIADDQAMDAGDPLNKINAKNRSKVPQGYEDGRMLLYKRATAGALLEAADPKTFVETYNEIYFGPDDDELRDHPATSEDVRENFKDLKVCSKWDLNNLVKWVKKIRRERDDTLKAEKDAEREARRLAGVDDDEDDDDRDPERITREIDELKKRDAKAKKRSERKVIDKKLLQAERIGYNPEDHQEDAGQDDYFQFSKAEKVMANAKPEINAEDYDMNAEVGMYTSVADLDIHAKDHEGRDTVMDVDDEDEDDDEEGEEDEDDDGADDEGDDEQAPRGKERLPTSVDYYRNMEKVLDRAYRGKDGMYDDDDESTDDGADDAEDGGVEKWVDSDEADDSSTEGDEDSDSIAQARGVGGDRKRRRAGDAPVTAGVPGEDGDVEPQELTVQQQTRMERKEALKGGSKKEKKRKKKNMKGGFEEIPSAMLDPDVRAKTLAIGTQMLDRKRKREIIEDGIHRWAFADEGLPRWFLDDEQRHNVRHLPVTKAQVEEQKMRFREINARPSKKVAEAVARRRKRAADKLKSILVKEKNDPRLKGTTQGLTVRKLMRSKQLRYRGKAKHKGKGDARSKAESRGAKKREKYNRKKSKGRR